MYGPASKSEDDSFFLSAFESTFLTGPALAACYSFFVSFAAPGGIYGPASKSEDSFFLSFGAATGGSLFAVLTGALIFKQNDISPKID